MVTWRIWLHILSNSGGLNLAEELSRDLQRLIDDTQNNRELECREFLRYTKELLVYPDIPDRFVDVETERIENLGRSDYLVVADVLRSGDCYRRAYLWELKAPQCFIYEEDTRTRLKPSQDFMDAENQLLNYYYGLKENGVFLQQYQISAPSDISLGGIIIGCHRTKVRGNYTEVEKTSCYNIAKRVRDQLYDGKLKVRTWDEIRSFISAPRRENIIR
jgi:hypothetical protein